MTAMELGPLMSAVLGAQARQAQALSYPAISAFASEVAHLACVRRTDLLWPVDAGAHKLSGALEVITAGELEVRSPLSVIGHRSVLLLATVAVSGADIAREAQFARAAGASSVHGCAIDDRCAVPDLDSFTLLSAQVDTAPVARSA